MVKEVILSKLGQTMEDGRIVKWLVTEGDFVQRGQVLLEVETDKTTLEVEATSRGFLRKILVQEGQVVPVLTVIGLMTRTEDEDISGYLPQVADILLATSTLSEADHTMKISPEAVAMKPTTSRVFASPRARKLARDEGIDLTLLKGSGPNGRITDRDVRAYLKLLPMSTPVARRLAQIEGIDLRKISGTGPSGRITKADVERLLTAPHQVPVATPTQAIAISTELPLSGIRSVIANRMHESHQATAPVTLTTEVDVTKLVEVREQLKTNLAAKIGFDLGYNELLILIVAYALRQSPYMNTRLKRDMIQQLDEVHVALAVDTERGLLAPVVRNADQKGLIEIAQEVRQLVERAQTGKALPDDLSGSTFTITNLGVYEIDAFTPLINLPNASILGVGRIKDRPVVVNGELRVRKTMWISLTFDHRLIDGAPAARFLQYIKDSIEDPNHWLNSTREI